MEAGDYDSGSIGGLEIEEVEFPERLGEVHRGSGETGHIVFHELVRRFDAAKVYVRDDEVVVDVQPRLPPSHSIPIDNLRQ